MKGKILIVEDLQEWRNIFSEALVESGYETKTVSNIEDAISILNQEVFNLLVLDISLKFQDAEDEAGIEILRHLRFSGENRDLKTIVVSAYGTKSRMRNAFVEFEVEDFIDKGEFSKKEFLNVIERIFQKKVRSNPNLTILPDNYDFASLFVNTSINNERIRANSDQARELGSELQDLLRRLFYDASTIVLEPMSRGKSGVGVLLVKPVMSSGLARPLIVKFGDINLIEQEHGNYKKFVEGFIGHGRSSSIIDVRYTVRLGGIKYSFLGTDAGQLKSLIDFYPPHTATEVINVIKDFFDVTVSIWYHNCLGVEPINLLDEYLKYFNLKSLDDLKNKVFVGKLKRFYQQENLLEYEGLEDLNLVNPFTIISKMRNHLFFSTRCITHGDLNAENMLVDNNGQAWLIDFYRTGLGHILRDCAQLEVIIKIFLFKEFNIDIWYPLELKLAEELKHQFNPTISGDQNLNDEAQKAYEVIRYIRSVAVFLVRKHGAVNMDEYGFAIGMNSLNAARFLSLTTDKRLQAIVSASLNFNTLHNLSS